MARQCSICTHPEHVNIDKAIVSQEPYRRIASRFCLVETSIRRHAADHLLATIVAAWQAERAGNGEELADELRACVDTIKKQLAACDAELTDPDDPTRYTLAPRTHEIVIHTEQDRGPNQRPLRRKMRLSEALALVDGKERIGDVGLVEAKTADPRKLLLDTSRALEGPVRMLFELAGRLQVQGTASYLVSPEWTTLRVRMLDALAPYPEAQLALAESLSETVTARDVGLLPAFAGAGH